MALSIYVSDELAVLADQLAEQLAVPLPDPMEPELVAVPSVGLQRWLKLHLASSLGANGTGDGIAANITMPFPGVLRSRLFSADREVDEDPWNLSSLVWAVHHVLVTNQDDQALRRVELPEGGTWYGRARRIADLFDRYATRRPGMLQAWMRGEEVDAVGGVLPEDMRWQSHLYRLVHAHIGVESPADRLGSLLTNVAAGTVSLDLPSRFSIFGVATLPGGKDFADLLKALGDQHEISLFMLDPVPATSRRLISELSFDRERLRSADTSGALVRQPLVRSWGRPSREAQLLINQLQLPEVNRLPSSGGFAPGLLGALQAHISNDAPAAADVEVDPNDRSITFHACTGPMRQVEVVRDQILAALEEDHTLNESDILVVCPDLPSFAPLIEGVFGPSADRPAPHWGDGPQRLRYTISDRELRRDDSLNSSLAALVRMIGGRYTASDVLDFCRMPPVAQAFGFDPDAISDIDGWLDATEVRWGLNQTNREQNNVARVTTNTWHHGIHQLLVGMAIHDDDPTLGPEDIPPWGVESGGIDVLNRLVALFERLQDVEEEWIQPAPIGRWVERLSDAIGQFFQVPYADLWQVERTRASIEATVQAADRGQSADSELEVKEIAMLLDERLSAGSSRPRFFDGAVTFTSLRPLRWVPHRMICVLGLDDGALVASFPNGDDLLGAKPDIGDPDPRADQRQSLLEVVLAAQDRLVVLRTGHDVRSNTEVPPSVVVSELRSELLSIVAEDSAKLVKALETSYARHSFDPRNFNGAAPLSFDRRALRAAAAMLEGEAHEIVEPLDPPDAIAVVDGNELSEVIVHAPKFFLRRRMGATFANSSEGTSDNLPIEKDNLQDWQTLTTMLEMLQTHGTLDTYTSILRERGAYPVGAPGIAAVASLGEIAAAIHTELNQLTDGHRVLDTMDLSVRVGPVDVELTAHRVAEHAGVGPVRSTASEEDNRLLRPLWVELCVLTLHQPEIAWRAVAASKRKSAVKKFGPAKITTLELVGNTSEQRVATAKRVLAALIDLRNLGLTEPLPILGKVQSAESHGVTYITKWDGLFGMMDDTYVLAAYGRIPDAELLAIEPRDGDPTTSDGKVFSSRYLQLEAFIDELWVSSVKGMS